MTAERGRTEWSSRKNRTAKAVPSMVRAFPVLQSPVAGARNATSRSPAPSLLTATPPTPRMLRWQGDQFLRCRAPPGPMMDICAPVSMRRATWGSPSTGGTFSAPVLPTDPSRWRLPLPLRRRGKAVFARVMITLVPPGARW